MAAAACSPQSSLAPCTGKLHREHLRKSKDSRRRQAALLFLTNISLDGRPVRSNASAAGPQHAEFQCSDIGATVNELPAAAAAASGDGTFSSLAVPRLGLLSVPPILVLPSDSEFSNVGSTEVFLERREARSPRRITSCPRAVCSPLLSGRGSLRRCCPCRAAAPRWTLDRGGFSSGFWRKLSL